MAVVARQLQNAHTEKDRQISSVLQRVSLQEQAMLKANKYIYIYIYIVEFFLYFNSDTFYFFNRSLANKVKKLQEALNDQQLAFNALSAKNALLEADITVATQRYNDEQNEIKKLRIEQDQLMHQIQEEYKQEKDVN